MLLRSQNLVTIIYESHYIKLLFYEKKEMVMKYTLEIKALISATCGFNLVKSLTMSGNTAIKSLLSSFVIVWGRAVTVLRLLKIWQKKENKCKKHIINFENKQKNEETTKFHIPGDE